MIRVHGYLGEVSAALQAEAGAADLVVGGRRHLDVLGVPEQRRVVLGALSSAVPRIAAAGEDARVVVVASGDPGLFGIVRRLRDAGLAVQVVPVPSSVQAAFARIGMAWDDAEVVSIHGRDPLPGIAVCRAWGKVAVMTGPDQGLVELARALADTDRRLVLCERLGEADEQVREYTVEQALEAEEVRQPNLVLVLDPRFQGQVGWRLGAPREDSAPPAVGERAAALFCRMLPGLGDLLWVQGDLGREVGALAAHQRAAVIDLDRQPLPCAGATWVVADRLTDDQLSRLDALRETGRIITTGDLG